MKSWEIWWADVKFEENTEEKCRPVIVIDDRTAFVLSLYVTSASPRPGYCDYVIQDWEFSGLSKPSTVRLDKMLSIDPSKFVSKIGTVSQRDKILIQMKAPFPLR